MKKRESFNNKWGFVLACIGSAVGMGNIWMFPTRVLSFIMIMFDYFGITYNKIVSLYSTFTYFFRLSKKDRLIESTINETTRFIMIQEEILKYSNKLKAKEISEGEYKECFDVFTAELINSYQGKFISYRKSIEKNMKGLLDNRELKTYTNI